MAEKFITVVSGLPRSGTSLLMQMLHAGGVPVLVDDHRPDDLDNPRGYFEYEPVKRLRADRTWLPAARGRAVKIIHLLLRELPMDGSESYRVIFMRRPLAEVLASQHAMLTRAGRPSADPAVIGKVFEEQSRQVQAWLAAQPCVRLLPLDYHDVLRAPAAAAATIAQFLEMPLDLAGCVAVVDPALHRQRLNKT